MSSEAARNREVDLGATIEVDGKERLRISLTALGAIVGALIAFLATGIIIEGLIVMLGGLVGWGVGLLGAVLIDRRRREEQLENTARDELYEQAQELGIEGRSQMSKEELARAVARSER